MKIFTQELIDSHMKLLEILVICCTLFPASPKWQQYQNHSIDVDAINPSYSDFLLFLVFICLPDCESMYIKSDAIFFTYVGSCIHHHRQDTELFQHHKDPSYWSFYNTSISLYLILATTNLSTISKILSFSTCYVSGIIQCTTTQN